MSLIESYGVHGAEGDACSAVDALVVVLLDKLTDIDGDAFISEGLNYLVSVI